MVQYVVLPVFEDAFSFWGRGIVSHLQVGEGNASLGKSAHKQVLNHKLMFNQDFLDFSGLTFH